MTTFDFNQYTAAIETYADDNVEIAIANVQYPGAVLNPHESGTFDVQITNNGPVTVRDLTLHVSGENGTLVRHTGTGTTLVTAITTKVGDIPDIRHHETKTVVGLGFQVPSSQPDLELLEATVEDWYPDFEHIYTSHTKATTKVKGTWGAAVENPNT